MRDRDELNIDRELICAIMDKSREFHAKEEVTFSEPVPNSEYEYDWAQILADHQDDMTYLDFKDIISSMRQDRQVELFAMMLFGREDFSDMESARSFAMDNLPENLADYLIGQPYFSDYLEAALAAYDLNCED